MTAPDDATAQRAAELFDEQRSAVYRRTDRMFAALLAVQWVAGVVVALVVSPATWTGKTQAVHAHVYAAVLLGGVITSLPVALALLRPGQAVTRYVVAAAQMLWSALLIHLTGGRIETHFHVFGSLAFLSFYRDWRVLVPATVVVAADHFLRQMYWPESVFGVLFPEWWRFLEHAFWVVFEDVFLVMACVAGVREMHEVADRRAEVEALSKIERAKSVALDAALTELRGSQEAQVRAEKLAAVGQLAASVGHELRNPLSAVRTAAAYVAKRVRDPAGATDPRVPQFLTVIDRELEVCTRIIGDLLDFARERPAVRTPCPLGPLVDEAMSVVSAPASVALRNQVDDSLPIPDLDREQFRQVLVNLIQNAAEAIPAERGGSVTVHAEGGGDRPWRVVVEDDGAGIPADMAARIFEPLFTTKTKGTGLGLAIVAGAVKRHGGTLSIDSEPGRGTRIAVELPGPAVAQVA